MAIILKSSNSKSKHHELETVERWRAGNSKSRGERERERLAWSLMKGGLEALQSHWKEEASNFQSTSW
jgi:hypothetical protein